MSNPKVSIIVPCYNAEQFIAETLTSVQNSDYDNWECIVVNDGSTDKSQDAIVEFCERKEKFTFYKQKNKGVSVARNLAIQNSSGKYILPLDADDLITAKYISDAVQILENKPNVKLVYCLAKKFGAENCSWNLPEYDYKKLLIKNMIFCTAMYRRVDYDKTRGYDESMRKGFEDWDFWIELLKTGGDVYRIPEEYFHYRVHNKKKRKSHSRVSMEHTNEIYQHIYNNHKEEYIGLIDNPIRMIHEHAKFKKKYNILRRLMFQKLIP